MQNHERALAVAVGCVDVKPPITEPIPDSGVFQRLIATGLAERTVITLAHRLQSLKRYDLILETSEGLLLRVGAPRDLIPRLQDQFVA